MLRSRKYKPGDEKQINQLYRILTDRNRNHKQYAWEWLQNPYEINSKWVIYEKNGRIVGHHGLIPTPVYVFDKTYLAGKTENTMLHPDYRGKHVYFQFEKKFFEEAKEYYQILFTTTGQGAPGKLREKLGYKKLGNWDIYRYYYANSISNFSIENERKKTRFFVEKILFPAIYIFLNAFNCISNIRFNKKSEKFEIYIKNIQNEELDDIEALWLNNRQFYKNNSYRGKNYMCWRINNNPHHTHKFIGLKKGDEFLGYLIYFIRDKINVEIVDIFVKKNNSFYFQMLIRQCKLQAKNLGVNYIEFSFIGNNSSLKKALTRCSFLNIGKFVELPFYIKNLLKVSDENEKKIYRSSNWYITGLFLEGL